FVSLGGAATRGAAIGVTDTTTGNDFYAFSLAAGDTATIALQVASGTPSLLLQNSAGTTLALSAAGPTNVSRVITDFTATVAGTYYAVVNNTTSGLTYQLLVTRNAEFDTEPNNTFATAQNIGGAGVVLGAPMVVASTVVPGTLTSVEGDSGNT